jgi:putative membrane protein
MERNSFFGDEARREVSAAVKFVESTSAAELVVAVRHQSGNYRSADYLAGALGGFAMLVLLLFHPHAFAVRTMPLDVAAVFAIAAWASSKSPFVRRLLTSPRSRAQNVAQAARAAFVDLGVSKTRGRTGVLVFVSMLERTAEVVGDLGVAPECLRAELPALKAAVAKEDLRAFITALRAFSSPLCQALPRAADDVNELPDEMQ